MLTELLKRLEVQLECELKLVFSEEHNYWAVVDSAFNEVIIGEQEYMLIEAILDTLGEDLPDCVDFFNRNE